MGEVPVPESLGVAGFVVVLCLIVVKVLWSALQEERRARIADQQVILPALTQATAANAASTLAIDRVTQLYEHRLRAPGGEG